jgi:hypothetical protein
MKVQVRHPLKLRKDPSEQLVLHQVTNEMNWSIDRIRTRATGPTTTRASILALPESATWGHVEAIEKNVAAVEG